MPYKHVLLLMMTGLFSACSSMDIEHKEYDRPDDYIAPLSLKQQVKVKTLWSRDVGSGSDEEFAKLIPSVSEQGIYTVSASGKVIAWNHKRFPYIFLNQKKWQVNLNEEISGGVFEGYGSVLVVSSEGKLFALDSETGEQVWQQDLEGEVLVPPQANGRIAVVQMTNGALHGLDFRSGEKIWVYKSSVPSLTLRGTSTPLIVQDMVYAGLSNGKLVAIDLLTGTVSWESSVFLPEGGTELEQVVDVDGNLLIEGERIFAASYQGKVASFYRQNGRALWKNDASNFQGLEKGLGQIYSVENDGTVNGYDLVTGELSWTQNQLKGRSLSAPATQNNYLVVGDEFGYIYWLKQNDGELVASKYLGRGAVPGHHHWNSKGQRNEADDYKAYKIFSKPVIHNGVLYVQNRFGAIAAYQLEED